MVIWLCMLVPVAVVAAASTIYRHKVVWWEPAVLLLASSLFIFVSKVTTQTVQVSDTEYWGGYVTQAEYYEDWNEKVSCRHEIACKHPYNCGTKNSPSTCYRHSNDGYEHSFDVDEHAAYWQMTDSNGATFGISSDFFDVLAARWQSRRFVELNRNYHTNDGDKYVAEWDRRPESIETTAAEHRYENRVQASRSTFRFPDVDPKRNRLFDYPQVQGHRQRVVLGAEDPAAEAKFQYLNATLGREKQVRVFVLVFRDRPQDAALMQQAYWQGGNKNEFVVCVGTDSEGNVTWAYPFAWSAVDERSVRELLTDTRMKLVDMGRLDLPALADWLHPEIRGRFRRMPFARFSYLTVEPPTWVVVLVFVLTLAMSAGWAVWAVGNDHVSRHDDDADSLRYAAAARRDHRGSGREPYSFIPPGERRRRRRL